MSITSINFIHSYTYCSKDSRSNLLQPYQKANTEIHSPKYKVHVLDLSSGNRIMMLSSWFCYHIIFSDTKKMAGINLNATNFPIKVKVENKMAMSKIKSQSEYFILFTQKKTMFCISDSLN